MQPAFRAYVIRASVLALQLVNEPLACCSVRRETRLDRRHRTDHCFAGRLLALSAKDVGAEKRWLKRRRLQGLAQSSALDSSRA